MLLAAGSAGLARPGKGEAGPQCQLQRAFLQACSVLLRKGLQLPSPNRAAGAGCLWGSQLTPVMLGGKWPIRLASLPIPGPRETPVGKQENGNFLVSHECSRGCEC